MKTRWIGIPIAFLLIGILAGSGIGYFFSLQQIENLQSDVTTLTDNYTTLNATHQQLNQTLADVLLQLDERETCTLSIQSSPPGVNFRVYGIPHTTPWTGNYSKGVVVVLEMPNSITNYTWLQWMEEEDTERIKAVVMNVSWTLTGIYEYTPPSPVIPPFINVTWSETTITYFDEVFPHMLAVTYGLKSIFKATAPDATPAVAEDIASQSDGIVNVADIREAIAIRWATSTKTSMPPIQPYEEALALGYEPPFEITPNKPFRDMPEEERMPYAREKVNIHEWAASQKYSEAAPLNPPYYDAPYIYERTQELLATESLIYSLTTNENTYAYTEDVVVQFEISNPTNQSIILKFPSSKQIDYAIHSNEGFHLYQWSHNVYFTNASSEIRVNPNATYYATLTHTPDMYLLQPGEYEIEAIIDGYYNTRSSLNNIKIFISSWLPSVKIG